MAAEKRPASNVFGTSQLVVKRQKSDANLGGGNATALVNGNAANGALIQKVRSLDHSCLLQWSPAAEPTP